MPEAEKNIIVVEQDMLTFSKSRFFRFSLRFFFSPLKMGGYLPRYLYRSVYVNKIGLWKLKKRIQEW